MADLNQCTSRTLASKAGISSVLAGEIVNFRKQKGSVKSFSELWYVDGMTRPIMKNLTSNFIIRDVPFSETLNINNSNHRKPYKNKKQNSKGKVKQKSMINKPKIAKANSRFFESLPLLSNNDTNDGSLLTIYTPVTVQSTPSRDKIITVYQVTSPVLENGLLPGQRNNQPTTSQCNNHAEISTQTDLHNKRKVIVNSTSRIHKLSPTKDRSIREWLQSTGTENTRGILTHSMSRRRGRRHFSKRHDRAHRYHGREESSSRSRSCSRSPLLRQSSGGKNKRDYLLQNEASQMKHYHQSPRKKSGRDKRVSGKHDKMFADGPLTLLDLEAPTDDDNDGLFRQTSKHYSSRNNRNRSMSVEPEDLRKERFKERNNHLNSDPQMSSAVKQKVKITEPSKHLDGHNVTRRSLWKDSRKRRPRSSNDHHRHHSHHKHSRSHSRYRSRAKEDVNTDSNERNGSCIIL